MAFIESLESLDRQLFLALNGMHNEFWDQLMWWASMKYTWIPLYLLLLIPLWKDFGRKIYFPLVAVALIIVLSDQLSVHLFKNVFERYRPCHNIEIMDIVHTVNNKCGGKFGFVSSHASNSFSLAIFLAIQWRRNRKWLAMSLLFWAAIVSYSRIYLGSHYPGDIAGGALLGAFIAYMVHLLMHRLMRKTDHAGG